MKIKLIAKLQTFERDLSWFWKHKISPETSLSYSAFMNQLAGRGKIRDDIEKIITEFLGD